MHGIHVNLKSDNSGNVNLKTRVFLLPHSEDRTILSSFVWTGYQRVTDGQTDRWTDRTAVADTALCIASNAAVL